MQAPLDEDIKRLNLGCDEHAAAGTSDALLASPIFA